MSTQQTAGDTIGGGLGDVNVPLQLYCTPQRHFGYVAGWMQKCKARIAAHPTPWTHTEGQTKKWGGRARHFLHFFTVPWIRGGIFQISGITSLSEPRRHTFFFPKKVPEKNQQGGHPGDMFFYHQMLYSSGSRLVVYGEETIEIRPWSRFMWTCWMDGPGRFWRQQVRYIDWLLKRFQGNIAVCVALVFWDIINLANGPKARS